MLAQALRVMVPDNAFEPIFTELNTLTVSASSLPEVNSANGAFKLTKGRLG